MDKEDTKTPQNTSFASKHNKWLQYSSVVTAALSGAICHMSTVRTVTHEKDLTDANDMG